MSFGDGRTGVVLPQDAQNREIHVCVPASRRVDARPGILVHRTRHLPDSDVVRRQDGIDVTSPPGTAVDAAALLSADDLESLIEQGIDRTYFTIATLWRGGTAVRQGAARQPQRSL